MTADADGRATLYMSGGGQDWTEIGWTEGPITFLSPAFIAEGMPFTLGPRTWTATLDLDPVHVRRLRRWARSLGNPGPLCIDGREYRRRQQARKKRGR